jgi:tetratricopeptide (TPR) repeat protein
MRRFGRVGLVVLLLGMTTGQLCSQTAADFYEQSLSALREGKFELAIRQVRRSIEIQPIYPEAYNALGLLLGRTGQDPVSVITAFQTAIRQREEFADAHYNLGLVLAQIGQVDSAIAELRKALRYDPKSPDVPNALGLALMDRNMDEGIELLSRATRLKPRFVEAEFNLALAYHRKFGTDREIDQLHRVLALDPKHIVARNTLNRRLEETGRFDEALVLARETIALYPNSAEAHLFAGKCLVRMGDLDSGVAELKRAIAADSALSEAHYQLAVAYRRTGKAAEATREFAQADVLREQQHSDISAGIQLSEVDLKIKQGDLDQATTLLQKLIQSKPEWPDTHVRLGKILLDRGDLPGATREFEEAARIAPDDFNSLYNLGFAKAKAGAYPEATSVLQRALDIRPTSVEANYNLALAWMKRGQPGEAIAPLRRALVTQPDSAELQSLLDAAQQQASGSKEAATRMQEGARRVERGDIDGAIQDFRVAAALAPELPEAHQFLGAALLSTDLAEGQKELSRALELRPNYFEARYNLGLAKARNNQINEAIADFLDASRLNPNSAECHDSLGVAYGTNKDYQHALAEFTEAVRLKQDWALAQYHLGSALRLSGNLEAARSAFGRAEQLDPRFKNPVAR